MQAGFRTRHLTTVAVTASRQERNPPSQLARDGHGRKQSSTDLIEEAVDLLVVSRASPGVIVGSVLAEEEALQDTPRSLERQLVLLTSLIMTVTVVKANAMKFKLTGNDKTADDDSVTII